MKIQRIFDDVCGSDALCSLRIMKHGLNFFVGNNFELLGVFF